MTTLGKVMGLDLSLTATGVARAYNGRIQLAGTIKTAGHKGDDLAQREARLTKIRHLVMADVLSFDPELVVIEAPSYGSVHGAQHDRSGLWWLIVQGVFRAGYPVATVSPNGRAKYGTGRGNAPKDEVLAAVLRRYASYDLVIPDNNAADAVLLAAMGSRYLGHLIEDNLPVKNLDAMAGAYWPDLVTA